MGRVLTSSSVGLLQVHFCVAYDKNLGVKFFRKELKYVADMVAFIQMSVSIETRIKSYPPMMHLLYLRNHVNDDRSIRSNKIIKAA